MTDSGPQQLSLQDSLRKNHSRGVGYLWRRGLSKSRRESLESKSVWKRTACTTNEVSWTHECSVLQRTQHLNQRETYSRVSKYVFELSVNTSFATDSFRYRTSETNLNLHKKHLKISQQNVHLNYTYGITPYEVTEHHMEKLELTKESRK
jgi:hypothetical protein